MDSLLSIVRVLTDERHLKLRLFVEGNIIGILTGLLIALFRFLLSTSEKLLPEVYARLASEPRFLVGWLLLLLTVAYVLHRIVQKEPMTAGSGIPQVEGILAGKMDMNWARVLVLKFLGAVLGIGAGLSLGREGPSVQLGACFGQGLGRLTHRSAEEGHYLLATGAGAGLAAAFNAPLAGVIFCFEEITHGFSTYVLMGAVSAAVMATTVTQYFFGMAPVFHLGSIPTLDAGAHFPLLVTLGAVVGLVALSFNKCLILSLETYGGWEVPGYMKAALPLLLSVPLGFALPAVLGGGGPLVDSLVACHHGLALLVILFLAKFAFTMAAFGSGVPGGIFLPMLVLGAIAGSIFALAGETLGWIPQDIAVCYIVYGMTAYFSAVVKSPVTGVVLIMEMTGSFSHLLPLMICAMTAYLVADLMGSAPVYDMLLERNLRKRELAKAALEKRMHASRK